MNRTVKKELTAFVCLLLALAVFCCAAAAVFIPKRHDFGATWSMYLKEPEHSIDALFFGSSLVYCDLVPSVMYDEAGITSYLMAGPDQRIPMTYWYVKEACKTQPPKAVFIEATAMLLSGPGDSQKVNLTYMPWSQNRLIPTLQDADPEERTGLLFPLYAYHDRWDKLNRDDLQCGLLGYDADPLAGYTFLDRALVVWKTFLRDLEEDPEDYDLNLSYAEKIRDYCTEQGIVPVFFLAPGIAQPSPQLRERLKGDMERIGVEYWDCIDGMEYLYLNTESDYFDELHFNYRGAEKFSRQFGRRMKKLGLSSSPSEETAALWQERIDHFNALRKEWDDQPVRLRKPSESASAG